MTAREMHPAIGTIVEISTGVGNITMSCRVEDVKMAWGSPRILVRPVSGSGESWVELSRLRMVAPKPALSAGRWAR